jgi:hypothetical protein
MIDYAFYSGTGGSGTGIGTGGFGTGNALGGLYNM